MIRVNLLGSTAVAAQPKAWVPAEQRTSLIGLGMLLVTGLLIGGWWYYLDYQRNQTEEGILKAEGRIEQLKEAMKILDAARAHMATLDMDPALLSRSVNAGFSGGEKRGGCRSASAPGCHSASMAACGLPPAFSSASRASTSVSSPRSSRLSNCASSDEAAISALP